MEKQYKSYPWKEQCEIREQIKNMLTNYYRSPITSTSKYIWGKEVRFFYEDGCFQTREFRGTIEPWYVEYTYLDDMPLVYNVQKIAERCRYFECRQAVTSRAEQPWIHHLTDWAPLDNEQGLFLRQKDEGGNILTMVKYALIVDAAKFPVEA